MKRSKNRKKQRELNRTGKLHCPICNRECVLVQHHIHGRKVPMANASNNLVDLCPTCHNEVHNENIILEGWVMTTNGLELMWHKKEEESVTNNDALPYVIPKKP